MQPLLISTSFSSVRESSVPPPATSAASMFTSLMSLTMTATRLPSRLCRMWLRSVVFPAPRKPERTVTGSLVMSFVRGGLRDNGMARRSLFQRGDDGGCSLRPPRGAARHAVARSVLAQTLRALLQRTGRPVFTARWPGGDCPTRGGGDRSRRARRWRGAARSRARGRRRRCRWRFG